MQCSSAKRFPNLAQTKLDADTLLPPTGDWRETQVFLC
jgi:hypothetical protein